MSVCMCVHVCLLVGEHTSDNPSIRVLIDSGYVDDGPGLMSIPVSKTRGEFATYNVHI